MIIRTSTRLIFSPFRFRSYSCIRFRLFSDISIHDR